MFLIYLSESGELAREEIDQREIYKADGVADQRIREVLLELFPEDFSFSHKRDSFFSNGSHPVN